MTDNRTTELLCKLLEERGVSCRTHYLYTSWYVGPKLYYAVDNLDGTLTIANLTPEQAIAATLGSGTCESERDEWKTKAESALHENPYVGLVRGKQWKRTEISDYYCGRCGWKVTDHDSYCPECGGALHGCSSKVRDGVTNIEWYAKNEPSKLCDLGIDGNMSCDDCPNQCVETEEGTSPEECQRRLLEWLIAPHEGAQQDTPNQPNSQSDAPKTAQTGEISTSKVDIRDFDDTREKLEADVYRAADEMDRFYCGGKFIDTRKIIGWLDRQAAITERKWREYHERKYSVGGMLAQAERIKELQEKLEELTAELAEEKANAEGHWKNANKWAEMNAELQFEVDKLTAKCISLEKQRDHWKHVASKHAAEMQKLRKEKDDLEAERGRANAVWPRFEDGAPVRFGDIGLDVLGHPRKVDGVRFYPSGGVYITDDYGNAWWGNDTGPSEDPDIDHDKRVKRPPILAKDGKPIEVGETLYGESDGIPWTVDRIDYGKHHPVMAHYGTKERGLEPEWLTHEQPDSWERIAEELRIGEIACLTPGKANELADRIEKLAGEGA